MKNLLRVVALFVAVVLVASGCSYSEEAEPGVRNLKLSPASTTALPTFSLVCERSYIAVSWGCLNESEQHRAAGLLYTVHWLVQLDDTASYLSDWDEPRGNTNLLRLLIDFEALEVLCYTSVFRSMREEEVWPVNTALGGPPYGVPLALQTELRAVRHSMVDGLLSKVVLPRSEETPVVEAVRYQHLCPSWILEP